MSTQTPDTTTATLSADCSPLHVAMLARDEAKRTEDALALEIAAMKIEEKALGEQFMILTGLEKVPGSLEASRAVRRERDALAQTQLQLAVRKAETMRAREQANAAVREANDTYRDLATGATRYVHTLRKAQRAQAEAANVGVELDAEAAQHTAFDWLVAVVGLDEAQRVRDDVGHYPSWMRD